MSDVFVPNGGSRKDTAILLVGTAEEHGIDQRSIRTTPNGFFVPEELADLVAEGLDISDIDGTTLGDQMADALADEAEADEDADEDDADEDDEDDDDEDDDDEDDDDEDAEPYVAADYNVPDVQAYVTENPEFAEYVLMSEQAGKNRPTLVAWLVDQINAHNASGNRAEENKAQDKE